MPEAIAKITSCTINGKEFHPFKPYQGLTPKMLKHCMKHYADRENYEECTKIRDAMEAEGFVVDMENLPEDTSLQCSKTFNVKWPEGK